MADKLKVIALGQFGGELFWKKARNNRLVRSNLRPLDEDKEETVVNPAITIRPGYATASKKFTTASAIAVFFLTAVFLQKNTPKSQTTLI